MKTVLRLGSGTKFTIFYSWSQVNFEQSGVKGKKTSKRAIYIPRLQRCQRTKLYTVENQLYFSNTFEPIYFTTFATQSNFSI
jgi:hypothetical protein